MSNKANYNTEHAIASSVISALSTDYRSVYYVDLDKDDGICYRSHTQIENGLEEGKHFAFEENFKRYADSFVVKEYREGFLDFVRPENIREGLKKDALITYLYQAVHNEVTSWELMKIANTVHPSRNKTGEVHTVCIGFADVDEETRKTLDQSRALNEALAIAQDANKAKTSFLSNMSHEIRTPMNAIISIGSIAINDPDISPSTRDYLSKINANAQHLLGLINDILDMSRIESGRLTIRNEELHMRDIMDQVSAMCDSQCREKGLKFFCHLGDGVDNYYIGDSLKLKQVLINILGNAVKFTEAGGSVTFTVEKVIDFADKSTFEFIIEDTGVGMDEEFIPKLFDAFTQEDGSSTNKYGSTGLGMAITKNLVEMMNGDIKVFSKKDVGSRFTVTLTFINIDRGDDVQKPGSIKPNQLSVLVVSDNTVTVSYSRIELSKSGISVEIAGSAEEAIEKVKVNEARRKDYNIVLVDREMRERDSLEIVDDIKSATSAHDLVIIMLGFHFDDIAEKAYATGVNCFVPKPLSASEMLENYTRAYESMRTVQLAKPKKTLEGCHVLLAEDKEINAEIMTLVLEAKDIILDYAKNGKEAVEFYATKPEGYYDAILMDMRMPEMDGLEATGEIRHMKRKDSKKIPIIALTANAFDEDVQRSLQAGLNAHLTKPVEPETLYDTLERLIQNT
ncbi:MAG: response regulator [Lachnospiraceae bacterium]|jgi:signal transduction histidine kinase/DNA-binding response OmpR family regulator|nr:response regulator [Lachnospiraceae bacterium]